MSSSIFDSLYNSYGASRFSSNTDSYLDRYSGSPYSTTYSSSYSSNLSSRIPSTSYTSSFATGAYDKYYNYLDDLSTINRSTSTSSRRLSSDYSKKPPASTSSSPSYGSYYGTNSYIPSFRSSASSSSSYLNDSKDGYQRKSDSSSTVKRDPFSNYERWKSINRTEEKDPSSSISSRDRPLEVTKKRFSVRFKDDEETEKSREISPLKDRIGSSYSSFGSSTESSRDYEPRSYSSRYGRGTSLMPSFKSSFSSSSLSLPSGIGDKLSKFHVRDVKGDGGCYYRCLSLYFTGSEDNYMKYRREVMAYIREHLDSYSTMIRSELGGRLTTSDYFTRKTRSDRQDWAETTEIIATCCVYNINIHVLALVPGHRSTWEWLHFDPSIGTGKPSTASRDIHLYNQGSVHFQLCSPK